MSTHEPLEATVSRSMSFRRIVLSAALALAVAPTGAAASGDSKADYPNTSSQPAAIGDSKADYPNTGNQPPASGDSKADYPNTGNQPAAIGDSKADYPSTGPAPRAGDTPAEFGDEVVAPDAAADRSTPWLVPVLAGIILLGTVTGGARVAQQRRRTAVIAG